MASSRRTSKIAAMAFALLVSCLLKNAVNFTAGTVNLGLDGKIVKAKSMPNPLLEANEATNAAIQDCLEEGCSVDALMALDAKLAKDEATIQANLEELHNTQATEYSDDAAEQIAWLSNFLDRSGSLRAQLHTVSTLKSEGDFAAQLVRAAAVAFGGGRKGDYPAVGVSPFS